jgi:hypothetical protein
VNVERPGAFLRTYTSSDDTTVREIKAAFSDLGFDAEIEAHTFAGPAEILQYVALSAPVLALFTALTTKAGEDAYLGLKRLCTRILRARRDGSHARDDTIELLDTEGRMRAELPDDLPDMAYRQLIPLFLAYLSENPPVQPRSTVMHRSDGRVVHWLDGSGPRLVWSERWNRWLAYADSGYAGALPARRLPPIPSRSMVQNPAALPALDDRRRSELYRASGKDSSIVLRQRADIALRLLDGVAPSQLGRLLIVSEELVRAVGNDYAVHGLSGLRANSADATPSRIPAEVAVEILTIAEASPREWRGADDRWTVSSLAGFVVEEGVIEDVSHRAIKTLLGHAGFATDGAIERSR